MKLYIHVAGEVIVKDFVKHQKEGADLMVGEEFDEKAAKNLDREDAEKRINTIMNNLLVDHDGVYYPVTKIEKFEIKDR